MTESQNDSPRAPKNFQELIVDAIVAGNLDEFRKCCVTRNDINRRLLPCKELKPMPKYNPDERYLTLIGPTMTMYAIVCEQDEILKEILEKKSPDLSVTAEGYNAIHLAAMVKDCRCLKLLLECRWIQENINIPVHIFGVTPKEDEFTTALHVAVSSRRYANAILLLDELPPIKNYKAAVNAKREAPKEEEDENDNIQLSSASVNQKSSSGSTALYIAVYLHDDKMVDILLAFEADPEIVCCKGKNSIQLAKENQEKNNEQKKRQEEREALNPSNKRKVKKDKIDPIDRIVSLLDSDRKDAHGVEACKKLYAPELVGEEEEEKGEEEEENKEEEEEHPEHPEPLPKLHHKPERKGIYKSIMEHLEKLNKRIDGIESALAGMVVQPQQVQPQQVQPRQVQPIPATIPICSKCGASDPTLCQNCHKHFCTKCIRLANIHNCI